MKAPHLLSLELAPVDGYTIPQNMHMRNQSFPTAMPVILALLIALLPVSSFSASGQSDADSDLVIRSGFISRMFSEVDRGDAKAAIKVWGDIISKDMGTNYTNETTVFDSVSQVVEFLQNRRGDMVVLAPRQLFEVEEIVPLEPIGVAVMCDKWLIPDLLLARADSGINGIADLKGKRLLIDDFGGRGTSRRWLDLELRKAGLPPSQRHCLRVTELYDPGKVVTPVFFKQADACIVRGTSFSVMTELNPQLARSLKIIGSSAPFISGVVAFSRSIGSDKRQALLKTIFRLHAHPKGSQILMLFKIDQVQPYSAGMFDDLKRLLAAYDEAFPPTQKSAPAPGSGPIKL